MVEVCGIIADIKREEQGVYVFPQMTLMGYDTNSPELSKLRDLGIKIGDENARYEGVEICRSSPFKLMRIMAKTFGFSAKEASAMDAPSGRTCITWTLMTDVAEECIGIVADIKRQAEGEYIIPTCTIFGLDKEEEGQLESHGLKVADSNPRMDGVEVTGSSPFKVMRILCKHFGWETDGKAMQFAAPGDRITSLWQLTKKV